MEFTMHIRRLPFNIHPILLLVPFLMALSCYGLVSGSAFASSFGFAQDDQQDKAPISYALDVKPIFAANCVGCHQPSLDRGGYTMTDFENLMRPGDSGDAPIVAGKPDESYLLELISTHEKDGVLVSEMPIDADPLKAAEITIVRKWIEQGAQNDSTETGPLHDAKNLPVYTRLPNITSLDFSPDGKWIAVNGFHEVLLIDVSHFDPFPCVGESIEARKTIGKIGKRLVGISPRVQSIKFSPSGDRLAVAGGNPGLSGEVQIWDVATGKLKVSKAVSYDTVDGISWSPDGSKIAFGCTDTTLRAIDSKTGKQVLFNGAHDDWLRDTVFSPNGKQLVSVGRDMSCKLYDVETNRFMDNITSITPGALKGGISSVAMHPTRDEIVIGGSDGIPKIYRTNRITNRVIGDDANLVRLLPKMMGRIQSVAVSPDGKRIAASSSLNGQGQVQIYSYQFDPTVSAALKAILAKNPRQWNKKERETVSAYNSAGVRTISTSDVETGGVYSVAFHPDSNWVAAGGSDGLIRFYEIESGQIGELMQPIELDSDADHAIAGKKADWKADSVKAEIQSAAKIKPQTDIQSLRISPETIKFTSPTDYTQLTVQGIRSDGSVIDVSNAVNCECDESVAAMTGSLVQAISNGETKLKISYGKIEHSIPVTVDLDKQWRPNFIRDINPVLSKLGCNAGTCHGSQDGKKGFKLSLRGYDPIYDIRSFTDDLASRRINLARPSASLMLKKPAGQVPHVGGKLFEIDEEYYQLIHDWIADGAKLDLGTPRVASVQLLPNMPVLADANVSLQMRVVATYDDGTERDVTREAFVEIGDTEIASVEGSIVTAKRRGESPVLARFEGAFTATTLTVMGDRDGFEWQSPESWSAIDDMVTSKWQRMKIVPSGLCTDEVFIRRVYLDLTGLPPTADQVLKFLADERATKTKRDELIDAIIGNDSFVEHWSNKWADLLQVNRKFLGSEGAKKFRGWIREQVAANRPYDQFVHEILTATGSNRKNPAASYYKVLRTPEDTMENTTHLFLGTRFNCNKCHDHPFERWTQDQYYETAAFFAQISRKKDPASKDRKVGGSAVEGSKPLFEIIADKTSGDMKHDRTGSITAPVFPFESEHVAKPDAPRREQFADWLVSPNNPYFATSYVNRLWGYMMGVGLIEPLDDIRAGNPPTNPELLEYLRSQFVEHNFDTRHLLRAICKSRTYQLSIETNPFNSDDRLNYSHAMARRLPAEVLFDSLHAALDSNLKIPGVEEGTRAAALPDSGVKLPSGFLATLGRPARESACECERSSDLQLGSVLALVSGPDLARAIKDPENLLTKTVAETTDDAKVIDTLFLNILNRHATEKEIELTLESFATIQSDHQKLVAARDQRSQRVNDKRPELETARTLAIKAAQKELDATVAELKPDLLKLESEQRLRIEQAEKELAVYQSGKGGFENWVEEQLKEIQWHLLPVYQFESASKKSFNILADRSVLVARTDGGDTYTVLAKTKVPGITAVRLETLTDDSLAVKGPGLAPNGNFVLNHFTVEIADPNDPTKWRPVKIESAQADIEQPNFPIADAVNPKANNKGWAVGNGLGQTHWATFHLALPIGYADGSLLRFKLKQKFDPNHQIGRLRISVSNSSRVGLGLSEELTAELTRPAEKRQPPLAARIKTAFEKGDSELARRKTALAELKEPIPVDPKITQLREKLARVSQPLPPDSILDQLETDVKQSEMQLANQRLTAAQDLAWALINSPSFLFNR